MNLKDITNNYSVLVLDEENVENNGDIFFETGVVNDFSTFVSMTNEILQDLYDRDYVQGFYEIGTEYDTKYGNVFTLTLTQGNPDNEDDREWIMTVRFLLVADNVSRYELEDALNFENFGK